MIEPGRVIYVDDGVLAFEVLEIVDEKNIKARARNNGYISSRKGVNLPNTDVDLPALSEKDKNDLRFGVKNNVDMVFACEFRRLSEAWIFRSRGINLADTATQLSFGGARTSRISARSLVKRAATFRSSPRSRTARVLTTSPRFSPRLMV